MPQFVDVPTIFNSPVSFNILPRRNIDKIPMGNTVVSVANIEHFTTHNTGAITITAFTAGSDGQEIVILGDGFTTVQENATIVTNAGDILLAAGTVYRFVNFQNVWYYASITSGGGGGGVPVPLIVEGSVSGRIGYFHNTDTVGGYGLSIRNDGPDTNYSLKVSDASGSGYFQVYNNRLINFGPEGSALEAELLTQNATYFSIEGDATYTNAGIVMTSGDHKLTSMLYMTGGDRGMRLSWNYREPYQSGGTQMHSDPNYPVIQTGWETEGAFSVNYTRKFTTGAGAWDGSGKTFKLYGGGYNEGVGPYDARGEYTSLIVGNIGRGMEFGIANNNVSDYKMLIRMKGYDVGAGTIPSNPIYLWVGGALRNVQSFNDGSGHNVLYY